LNFVFDKKYVFIFATVKKGGIVPLFYYQMVEIESIKKAVDQAVKEINGFVVSISLVGEDKVEVLIDTDQGIMLNEIVKVSKFLKYHFPNFSDTFSIEISSPGIGKPLKVHRQYVKNIGRLLKIILSDGNKVIGRLTHVTDSYVELELNEVRARRGIKSANSTKKQIPFANIKEAIIQVEF
jgi:ribosome maturation factor RimP